MTKHIMDLIEDYTIETELEQLSEFWTLLTEKQKKIARTVMSTHKFKKNEVIYAEGEEPKYLMCLISGKVKIYRDGVCGRTQIIRIIKPVNYFGYRAYFANEPYVTSAAAFEVAKVLFIPMSTVCKFLEENIQLAMFIIRELAIDLGIADERTVNLTQKHLRGRLAETLTFLRDNYGCEEDGMTLNIYLSREDLASMSNMTTSNAIRTLTNFVNEKLIIVDGRKIMMLDEEQIRRISKIG